LEGYSDDDGRPYYYDSKHHRFYYSDGLFGEGSDWVWYEDIVDSLRAEHKKLLQQQQQQQQQQQALKNSNPLLDAKNKGRNRQSWLIKRGQSCVLSRSNLSYDVTKDPLEKMIVSYKRASSLHGMTSAQVAAMVASSATGAAPATSSVSSPSVVMGNGTTPSVAEESPEADLVEEIDQVDEFLVPALEETEAAPESSSVGDALDLLLSEFDD
jgi:hypothetical protein